MALQPDVWVEWTIDEVPSGTSTYRWSTRPLADENSFKEPRLRRVGTIRRNCSTDDGEPQVPTVDIDVDDADGVIRGLKSDPATRHGIGGEFAIRIQSETARKAGGTASDLMQGSVTKVRTMPGRTARISVAGMLGALFTETNLRKTYPQQRIGEEHPYAPRSSQGLVYPLYIGVFSDVGATDANGNSAEKGLLSAIDVGDVLLLADGTEVDQTDYPLERLDVPTTLAHTVSGTAGTQEVRYDVTALSDYGETSAVTLEVTDAPDLLNGTDYVALTWDAVDGASAYHVYRNRERVAQVTAAAYDDVGAETTGQPVPAGNTALIQVETDAGTATPWTRFVAAGKTVHVEHVYASDLASRTAPRRTRLGEDHYGTELLIYGQAGYPHADPYIDKGGIRQTVFYMRGPRVKQHRDGVVTIAWNGWGVETKGNGQGVVITQAFHGLEWLLNEEVLKNGGVGYLTGDYGPAETFSNGVPMLRGSKFTRAQDITKVFRSNDIGYPIQLALTAPTSLRTILRTFHTTFGSIDCPANRHGQYFPIVINDLASQMELSNDLSPLGSEAGLTAGALGSEASGTADRLLGEEQFAYRDKINILRWISDEYDDEKIQTRVVFNGGWDPDAQRPRYENREIAYDPATYGYPEPKQRTVRQCLYTDDVGTLYDAQDRYLRRHLLATRVWSYATGKNGIDHDLGTETLTTHYEGSSSADGDEDRRGLIIGHDTDANPPEEVIHRVLDLERSAVLLHPLLHLGSEAAMTAGALKSEASDRPAPVGAWRLR